MNKKLTFDFIEDDKQHFMLDIETLDTKVTTVIPSIGIVHFNPFTKEVYDKFQWNINDLQKQLNDGRTISISTMRWWMKQEKEAQEKTFNNKYGITLIGALIELKNFCISKSKDPDCKDIIFWGNGNTFDNAIIRNACEQYGVQYPAPYYNDLDLRTFKYIFKDVDVETKNIGTAHNAVDDALYQCNIIFDKLGGAK